MQSNADDAVIVRRTRHGSTPVPPPRTPDRTVRPRPSSVFVRRDDALARLEELFAAKSEDGAEPPRDAGAAGPVHH